ncbi:MAG: hypothetical protein ACRC8A_08430 [Microcoleaceae cyanobacterium]
MKSKKRNDTMKEPFMYLRYDVLECPKCGKHDLVQRGTDLYACVNCDFKKDFSKKPAPPEQPKDSVLDLLGLLAGALVLLALL